MNIVDNFAWTLSIPLSDKSRKFFFQNSSCPPALNSQLPVHVVLIGEPLASANVPSLANDLYLISNSHA